MIGYIYLTTNLIDGKKYIGKRQKPKFDKNYIGSGKYLKNAIKAHGKENFKCVLIEECFTVKELCDKEQYWIDYHNAVEDPMYYNLAKGGSGGQTPCKESTKLKISKANSGKIRSKEAREKYKQNCLNTFWINNGTSHKRVTLEESKNYLYEGSKWIKGQLSGRINGPKAESTKKLMHDLTIGKSHNEKWTKNQKESKKKSKFHWYTNGVENLYIKESDLEKLPKDFYPGSTHSIDRNNKITESKKGRFYITNGNQDKLIYPNQFEEYQKLGYWKGRLFGNQKKNK